MFGRVSFCYVPCPPSPAFPLSALRLSAFPLRVFPAASPPFRELARARTFLHRFSASSLSPNPPFPPFPPFPPWLPRSSMSPFCYSFCPARLRVFLARLLPLPDPFILLPQSSSFSLGVSPFFSVFVSFPEQSSTSDTFLFLFHSYSLFFGRTGLFFLFPVASLSLSLSLPPRFPAPLSSRRGFSGSLVFILTFNDNGNYVAYRVSLRGNRTSAIEV